MRHLFDPAELSQRRLADEIEVIVHALPLVDRRLLDLQATARRDALASGVEKIDGEAQPLGEVTVEGDLDVDPSLARMWPPSKSEAALEHTIAMVVRALTDIAPHEIPWLGNVGNSWWRRHAHTPLELFLAAAKDVQELR